MKLKIWLLALSSILATSFALAQGADYPNRPIRMIVPYGAGGTADAISRLVAKQMEEHLGQPVVVENRPGANGAIGLAAVKSLPADGYTISHGSSGTLVINPLLMKDPGYDALKDFKPIGAMAATYPIWLVRRDSKITSIGELVQAARANPGRINVGTATSSYALMVEWFNRVANVKVTNIAYNSPGQSITDLLGGQVDAVVTDNLGANALLQGGKVRALGSLGAKRPLAYPDVPTFAESGYPTYVNTLWAGMIVRADTPAAVTDKLTAALRRVWPTAAFIEFTRSTGLEPLPLDGEQLRKRNVEDLNTLRAIVTAAGIKPE